MVWMTYFTNLVFNQYFNISIMIDSQGIEIQTYSLTKVPFQDFILHFNS